jgi:hypothetical protein
MKKVILLLLLTGFQFSGKANSYQQSKENPWRKHHRSKHHWFQGNQNRRLEMSVYGISRLPIDAFCLPHGRRRIFFHDGYFYRQNAGCYNMVPAPLGIFIPRLPFKALKIFHSGLAIWFLAGNFYRESINGYQVIETPLGIRVPELPEADLESVFMDGEKFFLFNNVLWKKRETRHAFYFEAIDYLQSGIKS